MPIPFTKMHGLGNDFVMVDARSVPLPQDDSDLSLLARSMCHRHLGVGADGLILLLESTQADARMRMFNPDGTEAEMCGNGIRCLAGFARVHGLQDGASLSVETGAGTLGTSLVSCDEEAGEGLVEVDMGPPRLEGAEVPVTGCDPHAPAVNESLEMDGTVYTMTAVSMGNPHAIFFLDAQVGTPLAGVPLDRIPLEELGSRLEKHPRFPRHANIEFATLVHPGELAARVWERGAGATRACGTGACAVMVAACLTGRAGEHARVFLPGGPLDITWQGRDRVRMRGPYRFVFDGVWRNRWPHKTPGA